MANKNNITIFLQSCDSRICRKKNKEQLSDICDAISTLHTIDSNVREITCTECGKVTKLSK